MRPQHREQIIIFFSTVAIIFTNAHISHIYIIQLYILLLSLISIIHGAKIKQYFLYTMHHFI